VFAALLRSSEEETRDARRGEALLSRTESVVTDDDLDLDFLLSGSNDEVRDRGFAESRIAEDVEDVRALPALIVEVPLIVVSCLDVVDVADVDRRRDMGLITIFPSDGVSISSTALAFAAFCRASKRRRMNKTIIIVTSANAALV
jgi:hypothetical protein